MYGSESVVLHCLGTNSPRKIAALCDTVLTPMMPEPILNDKMHCHGTDHDDKLQCHDTDHAQSMRSICLSRCLAKEAIEKPLKIQLKQGHPLKTVRLFWRQLSSIYVIYHMIK